MEDKVSMVSYIRLPLLPPAHAPNASSVIKSKRPRKTSFHMSESAPILSALSNACQSERSGKCAASRGAQNFARTPFPTAGKMSLSPHTGSGAAAESKRAQ